MDYLRKKNCQFKPINIERRFDEPIVQDGLAMSPAEMMDMVNRGIPISNSNLQLLEVYKTGDKDFSVPMEFRRNVDMADMWQHRQEMRTKVREASDKYLSNLKTQENGE